MPSLIEDTPRRPIGQRRMQARFREREYEKARRGKESSVAGSRVMKRVMASCAIMLATPAFAETGVERWVAVSRTAMAITGDIVLSPRRLTMAGKTLRLRVVADNPAFQASSGAVPARILRVTRAANPVLLNGNRMCGTADIAWIVVWRARAFGQSNLNMAVFSGSRRPSGEASRGLCGTFMFAKP